MRVERSPSNAHRQKRIHYESLIHQHRLIQHWRRGILPAPKESLLAYFERAERSTSPTPLPKSLTECYGPESTTAPLHYSDQGIHFWEVALTWVDHEGQSEIQLRTALKRGSYLGYCQEEVLAHEAVHALRAPLFSERFEECFAYATSPSFLRRFLGPLFSERFGLLVMLIVSIASGYFLMEGPWWIVTLLLCLPLLYFFLCFYPWYSAHRVIAKAKGSALANQVTFLLTDAQIVELSKKRDILEVEEWVDTLGDTAQRCLIEGLWSSASGKVMIAKESLGYIYGV